MPPIKPSRKLERAIDELLTRMSQTDEEDDHEYEGVLIERNISIDKARRFMDKRHPVILRFVGGDLFAVELTRASHSRVGMQLISFFYFGDPYAVDAGANVDVYIQGDLWQPDHSVGPRRTLNPHPTMIVEVAHSESLASLYRCGTTYLDATTSVQTVLCVKLWGRRTDGTRALLFMLFERNNMVIVGGFVRPTRLVSFGDARLHSSVTNKLGVWGVVPASVQGYLSQGGDAPCTVANQPVYQVVISAAVVFHGSTIGIPPAVANGYNIDLYRVQEKALMN